MIRYSHGRVVKRRQQILLDIPYLGGVLPKRIKNKSDMLRIQLEEPTLDYFGGFIVAGYAYRVFGGAYHINHELKYFIKRVLVVTVFLAENLVADVL